MKTVCRFEIGDLLPIGMTFIVVGIGMSYGISVMSDQKNELGEDGCAAHTNGYTIYNSTSGMCMNQSDGGTGTQIAVGTAEYNGSTSGILGVAKIPEKMGTIATVVVAAVIIGILVRYLMMRFN